MSDGVVQELIDNDGCRDGCAHPINPAGIVRLALDLQEARAEVARLESVLRTAGGALAGVSRELDRLSKG